MKGFTNDPPMDPDPLGEPAFVNEEEQDDVSKLSALLKELDLTGGVARVFRQSPGRAEFDYVGEMAVDGFSLETVKRVHGGGRYIVRFAAKGGRYVRSIKFSVDPSVKSESEMQQTTSPQAQGQDNSLFMMMLQQQQQAAQAAAASQQQMMTLMVTMMSESQKSMATVIAAALAGGRPQGGEPASKIIEVMTPMLIENMRPRNAIAEAAESLKIVKELANGEPTPEKEDDMMGKILSAGLPVLGALMNRGQQPIPPSPRPVSPQPPGQIPPPQDAAMQAAQAKVQTLLGQLRMVTPILVRAASKNSPIESYLDILDDTLDDEGYGMLQAILQREDWVAVLFSNHPGVIQHQEWFNNFREMILHGDDNQDPETQPEGSPANDAPIPGSPGIPG